MSANKKKVTTIDRDALPRFFEGKKNEDKWNQFWEEGEVYKYDNTRNRDETFVVDTPPPTVSGSLHIGHLFSYSHTDFIVRFQRMLGKNIFYPMGWDDNGLPTERRVQNYFHVRCEPTLPYEADFEGKQANAKVRKKHPQKISRKNFIELCNQLTAEDEKIFQALWTRLGLSIDWSLEYATISPFSQRIAQLSFLDLHEKGHIQPQYAPIMWDVDFKTSIAQAEIEDRESSGFMYTLQFMTEDPDRHFVIGTTRPELLPACVGVTCHPDDDRYKDLIGKYAITPLFGVKVPVFASDKVDPEKGSGIVMVCTFGDITDVEWWHEEKLQLRQILGLDGRLVPLEFGTPDWESEQAASANQYYEQLTGLPVKKARAKILELLGAEAPEWQGYISLQGEPQPVQRMVKYYEKGDRPLEMIPTRQWFVELLDKKEELIEKGKQVQWHPEFFYKRFEMWTQNLQYDWNISRQRFFGVPMPLWYKLDGEGNRILTEPMFATREQLPVDPMTDVPNGYTAEQRNQPNGFQGEKDVFDTWFTSSMSPYIASKWIDGDQHDKLFPFDVRPQSHEIIRTWAFYTIAKGLLHDGKIPWHHVLISGWILDPDRKKMSKSKGNVETPDSWMDKYSADAVRYWAARAKLGVDTTFDPGIMKVGQRLVTKIFNVAKFVYFQDAVETPIVHEIDKAFIAALRQLIAEVTQAFEDFDHAKALALTESFFWSKFTDTYVELVKKRSFDDDPENWEAQGSAVAALRTGMGIILRLFAPFLPYITEEVWSWIPANEMGAPSVHKAPWFTEDALKTIAAPTHANSFELAIECLESIHKFKSSNNASVGAEMKSLTIQAAAEVVEVLTLCQEDLRKASRSETIELVVADTGNEKFLLQGEIIPKVKKTN